MAEVDALSAILYILVCAVLVGVMITLAVVVGPRRRSPVKDEPFECGVADMRLHQGSFSVRYYLVALLFLLFDIEFAFLYPWAAAFSELGLPGYLAMMVFLAVVGVGLVYELKQGALEWA